MCANRWLRSSACESTVWSESSLGAICVSRHPKGLRTDRNDWSDSEANLYATGGEDNLYAAGGLIYKVVAPPGHLFFFFFFSSIHPLESPILTNWTLPFVICGVSDVLKQSIVITNFVRRFQSFIADTVGWWKNIMLAWRYFCNKVCWNQNSMVT